MDGCDPRWAEAGAGETILFLDDVFGPYGPGPAAEALARRHRVIVPTHPGLGGATAPDWLDTVSDLANFYLDVIEARDLRGVHLVGCGLGGWIAADLAIRDASRLASLTLVDAGGLALRGVPQCDPFLGGDDDVLRLMIHDPAIAERLVAATVTPESEDIRLSDQRIVAKLLWQPRLHDPRLGKWLHRIRLPALIVWGAEDRLYPRPYARAWSEKIAGSRVALIDNCGHLPQVEKPDELAALVSQFIAERKA